jgi:hypothetical protein
LQVAAPRLVNALCLVVCLVQAPALQLAPLSVIRLQVPQSAASPVLRWVPLATRAT